MNRFGPVRLKSVAHEVQPVSLTSRSAEGLKPAELVVEDSLKARAPKPKKRWSLRNRGRKEEPLDAFSRNALFLQDVEDELSSVCPDFKYVTRNMRHFAGRYLSAEKPHDAILGVVSARPREGRTTVALGVAGALAEIYSRVVLVEMETDEDAPTLCTEMNLDVTSGLRDYLSKDVALDLVLRPTQKENLWLLPAGPVTHQASRLDATARTRDLFSLLNEAFDVVVVDLPPVLVNEEAPALLAELDGVVLVATAGLTTTDEISRTLALCGNVPLRGVLLNKMHLRAPRWLASLVHP